MNPLRSKLLFVGRGPLVERLTNLLHDGQSCLLIGGRQAGKSTVLRQLQHHRLQRRLVHADAAGWQLASEDTALGALMCAIRGERQTKRATATRNEVVVELEGSPVALIIDNADLLLKTTWGPGFFSLLRWLDDSHMRDDIAIVLTGGPVLAAFKDPDDKGSPPLNTALPLHLDPLDKAAVAELTAHTPHINADEVLDQAGGHAWLTTRLLAAVHDGQDFEDAVEAVLEQSMGTFGVWERQLGESGRTLVRELPENGVPRRDFRMPPWSRHSEASRRARSIGVLRFENGKLVPGPRLFRDWFHASDPQKFRWDLAISYASEDHALAAAVHAQLRAEFKVFFAPAEDAAMWATSLDRFLPHTYGVESKYVLAISTEHYVRKHWTMREYRAATENAPGRVLLLNCGELPDDVPPDVVYRDDSPAAMVGLVAAIRQKLMAAADS